MKKAFLLVIALIVCNTIFAQNRAILLRETFDSNELPEGWSTSNPGADNWVISETNKSGGDANELKLCPTPQSTGYIRIITSPVNLSGLSEAVFSFRHYFDRKTVGGSIGVATSSNNGTTWSQAWTHTYSAAGNYTVVETFSTPDMGKDNVLFCIYYLGNTNNINGWYFDELEIMVTEEIDAKMESIDIPELVPAGNNDVIFSVQNVGQNVVNSFEASYEINGVVVSQTFETEIEQFATKQFTFDEQIFLAPGNYTATVNITSVNGEEDQNMLNNSFSKNFNVAIGSCTKITMIEHFSSSTCASCVILNQNMHALTSENPGKYTYTKYAMNWPSPGDIYYLNDGGVRKQYYGVSSVPHLVMNGNSKGYYTVTQEELDNIYYNTPAYINIKGAFSTEGNVVNIELDVMSYIDFSDLNLFVTINEKTTTENVDFNGETEFHHIVMKMVGGAQGTGISMSAGETAHYEFSHDMSNTFMEEIDDLEVAVWIQDLSTKEIYNSQYMYEYTDHPYPAQNLQLTENGNNINVSWEAPEYGNATGYNLYINGELILENTNEMSYTIENASGYYGVEVVALYDNGKESVSIMERVGEFVTENELLLGIYPNPVENYIYFNTNENIKELSIYNILGVKVFSSNNISSNNINVSDLHEGLYIMKISTENGIATKRFIKK